MNRRNFLLSSCSVAGALLIPVIYREARRTSRKGGPRTANAVRGLPQLAVANSSVNGRLVEFDLEARQERIEVGGRSAYLYGFNRQVPGPVLELQPGDHLRIRFRNALSEPTNLHYHGLHVSPTGNAD